MKVLQVNSVFGKGSTGKIIQDLHEGLLASGVDSIVCYGRGARLHRSQVRKTTTELEAKLTALQARITGIPYAGAPVGTTRLLKTIDAERPDVVHLHCINGYFVSIYRLLEYLKRASIPTVLTLHADFMFTGGCGTSGECERWMTGCGSCPSLRAATKSYALDRTHEAWSRMKAAFEDFEGVKVASVSPWLKTRAERSPILRGKKHTVVMNGLDTERIFFPRSTSDLRSKLGIGDKRVVLHVTSNFGSELKGSGHVLELARRLRDDGIVLIVVGNVPGGVDSAPADVLYAGRVDDQGELAQYYSLADVTLLTSSRETFSMVVAESLSCATPVVGFESGGPESIALPDFSAFVRYGDVEALGSAVRHQLCPMPSDRRAALREAAVDAYSRDRMASEYQVLYRELREERRADSGSKKSPAQLIPVNLSRSGERG